MSPRPAGYGEGQPRLDDDRLPVVLIILDGLGDRPIPELAAATPAEAARTPVLDAIAASGASGWHLPFGWGRAASSERAHWALFGYADTPFPGRAVLEALGAGLAVPSGVVTAHAALRTSTVRDGRVWVTGRTGADDADDAAALLDELAPVWEPAGAWLRPLPGGRGEAVLQLPGWHRPDITDSDPFFEDFHPWLRVLPTAPAGAATARTVTRLLLRCRAALIRSPVNEARTARGRPALDVLTTKWVGVRRPVPAFVEQVGVAGAAVTGTRLYRGLAALLGMRERYLPPRRDLERDLAARIDAAGELLADGARFVHVHTKATDDAGHTKQPYAKRDALEAIDRGLAGVADLTGRAVVAVTGDHATPSTAGVLHTGDPTPFVVAGPTVRPDRVERFGERWARDGDYGTVSAADVLALLFGHANRPSFLGHRPTPRRTVALPDEVAAMPADPDDPG